MTSDQTVQAALWMIPIVAVIQWVGIYTLVSLLTTGRRIFERKSDHGQMRSFSDRAN